MKTVLQLHLNKTILIFAFVLSFQFALSRSIETAYINMPEVLNPTISKENRLELLEYYKVGSKDSVINRFGNAVRVIQMDNTNQLLKIQNTKSTVFEMKLFILDDNAPVIGVIHTVCAPVCQSMVQFYDTAWSPIKLDFTMPKSIEWLQNDSLAATNTDKKWALKQLEDSFVSLTFSEEKLGIEATNNILEFLSDDIRPEITPFISQKRLIYRLNGRSWVLKKQGEL